MLLSLPLTWIRQRSWLFPIPLLLFPLSLLKLLLLMLNYIHSGRLLVGRVDMRQSSRCHHSQVLRSHG